MEKSISNNNTPILIQKASGDEQEFSSKKLRQSLLNAGAEHETVSQIVAEIENWIYPGVTSKKIYSRAFSMLRRKKRPSTHRYKLKQAILELGPTGYPFETLIGQVFHHMGFQTEVGIVVNGQCITHEMDVIATKKTQQHLVECKYHKDQGKHVSIQVPLYVRSRVQDIAKKRQDLPEYSGFSFSTWVITNTRFSSDSIQYGKCSGLKLMAWDYPAGQGLKDHLEKYKLYPITVLVNLTKNEKHKLLELGMVSCPQLLKGISVLKQFEFTPKKYAAVVKELEKICK